MSSRCEIQVASGVAVTLQLIECLLYTEIKVVPRVFVLTLIYVGIGGTPFLFALKKNVFI